MIATLLVGMLCVYLISFSVMFLLIGRRLHGGKMGTDAFAAGNLMLGSAYVLQLLEGPPGWSAMSVANHSLTLGALLAYSVGGARFFGRPLPLAAPLAALGLGYALVQVAVQWAWGTEARYALLSATLRACDADGGRGAVLRQALRAKPGGAGGVGSGAAGACELTLRRSRRPRGGSLRMNKAADKLS